ncbi:MAG: tRNA pseudouridine(55) synthase TruB [Epsilonproteobacteria bacterium]|nr:tRNA pseudouridine(55) synthase TruB [Campylobacterota bacterium]
MNRLFVVNKPIFKSSNNYMYDIKNRYKTKKVGFSGTLDPFATGCLIVATGQFTKLFQYLKKTPKCYRATLWLGASSPTLDIEKFEKVVPLNTFKEKVIDDVMQSFVGDLTYLPPKYSAKKINGIRAYQLAVGNKDVNLKEITSTIFSIQLLSYYHPFVHFEIEVSEGAYIRSIGAIIAQKLGVDGILSSLKRVREGAFYFDHERSLNPINFLDLPTNRHLGDDEYITLGKKLDIKYFENQQNGIYLVEYGAFFAIIEIIDGIISYKLNRILKVKESH